MKNIFDIKTESRTVWLGLVTLATGIALMVDPTLLPGMDLNPSYLVIGGIGMIYGKS